MKKKFLLSAIGTLALALSIGAGVSSTPVFAAEANTSVPMSASYNLRSGTNYFRTFPSDYLAPGQYEYGGLKYYVQSSGYINVGIVSNPESVKEIIMFYEMNGRSLTYNTIDWTKYTALEDMVVVGNNLDFATSAIGAVPSGTNLHVGAALNLTTALQTMPFKNIYINSTYYSSMNTISSTSFLNNLGSSNVEHIYYNDFFEDHFSSAMNSFNQETRTNKNGTTITLSKMESSKYPIELFYSVSSFDPSSPVFETEGYWSCSTSSNFTNTSQLKFTATSTDERVKVLDASNISAGTSLPTQYFDVIYMPNNENHNFSQVKCGELVIKGVTSITASYFGKVGAIRFLPTSTNVTISNNYLSTSSDLKKIYIPTEYQAKYQSVIDDEVLGELVEFYTYSEYVAPMNTFTDEEGTMYCSKDSKYTIEELLYGKELLELIGLEVKEYDALDVLCDSYELPIKDLTDVESKYSLREFDTIVVPKNISAEDVLTAFSELMLLDNGYLSTDVMSMTLDLSQYTPGYNGTIDYTVVYPNYETVSKSVNVKAMNVDGKQAYLLNGNEVYIVTNPTDEAMNVSDLMQDLKENYLMEANITTNDSPILDTTDFGYYAPNTYTTSQVTDERASVYITPFALTDDYSPETPDLGEDDNQTNNGNENNGDITKDELPEGYEFKEIIKVFTTSNIDGSRIFWTIDDKLLTFEGDLVDGYGFAVGLNNHNNQQAWSFLISGGGIDGVNIDRRIQVEIMEFDYNMGFVIFEDGDIAVVFNCDEKYTQEDVLAGLQAFMTMQNLDTSDIQIPEDLRNTRTYEGSYGENTIYIVNSGFDVTYTSSTTPVDQSALKEGYVALNQIYYTSNYTVEEVLRALGDNVLLKDGKKLSDYKIDYTFNEGATIINYVINIDDQELTGSLYLHKVESEYEYIFAVATQFDQGHLIINKMANAPEYTLNDVMIDVLSHFRGLMTEFSNEATIDFTKLNSTDVDGTYQVGNGNYYSYEFDVEVVNLTHDIKTNEVTINGVAQVGETTAEKLQSWLEQVQDKFADNKAFQIASIVFGSITGILLIYGIYLLIRKFIKWIK